MGITRFPHGILATPNIGSFFGMATGSDVWFVDGANGNDDNLGTTPDTAFKTFRKATDSCGVYDVIYVAPAGLGSSGEPAYYQDTVSDPIITADKGGVAIIGVGHSAMVGQPMQVCLKAYETTSGTTNEPCLSLFAPFCTVENLGFNRGNGTNGIFISGDSEGTYDGWGCSIYNCYFRNVRGTGATGDTGGAIYVVGGAQNTTIEKCMFYNCRVGIAAKSGTSVTEGLVIRDCDFRASAASSISADIYMYFQGQNYTIIDNIRIGHDVPSYASGHGACIVAVGGAEIGNVSRVYAMDADGTSHATTGTIVRVPTTMGTASVYNGDNALVTTN
jgi:hypothetical protein